MSVYYKEHPEYLEQSIESMLIQTVQPDEFVIVCDGKLTKELDSVLENYKNNYNGLFKIVRLETNQGLGKALNVGMKECSNSVIARMDSDDIAIPQRCEMQLKKIADGYDIVSGTVLEFEHNPQNTLVSRKLPVNNEEIYTFAKRRNPFNHPCVMYRREKVIEAGEYKDFPFFEDYYLWARMLLLNVNCYNIEEPILYMRAGEGMYRRRGGLNYLKTMLKFRFYLYKNNISGFSDFLISALGQTMVCILPNQLRESIYAKYLREK